MPYIKKELRAPIAKCRRLPITAGELNYLLTVTIQDYLGLYPDYERMNTVVGALECCKLELYRRKLVPYENVKLEENGDVY